MNQRRTNDGGTQPLHIAKVIVDCRDAYRDYSAPAPYFGTAPSAILDGLAEIPDVRVTVVSCVRRPVAIPERLAGNIRYVPVQVSRFGYMRSIYVESAWRVRRTLAKLQPDVVHGHGTELYCGLCAAFSGLPNVLTIHGNMRAVAAKMGASPLSFHWVAARLESVALRKAGGVFCNSAYTESQVASLARRTWRVPNALSAEFFLETRGAKHSRPLLLNVGTVLPGKQQCELLAAARELRNTGAEFELVFIGGVSRDSEYGRRFVSEVEASAGEGWVRHLGNLDRADLIGQLDRAHAIIHVSREESFGLAVAEALARNLRLFAFNCGGLVDVTAGISEAGLFAVDDWRGIVSAIGSWLRDGAPPAPPSAGIMRDRYSPRRVAEQHPPIYRELLSARS